MAVKALLTILLLALPLGSQAETYYQASPEKLAALEAQRCEAIAKEMRLISQRERARTNTPSDSKRLQARREALQERQTKYCPAAVAQSGR